MRLVHLDPYQKEANPLLVLDQPQIVTERQVESKLLCKQALKSI